MKPRRLPVTPRAQRELRESQHLGAKAALKALRSIQSGIRATTRISIPQATRPDLPEGYFRVVAKTHLVIFQIEGDAAKVVRLLHGARDISVLLGEPKT